MAVAESFENKVLSTVHVSTQSLPSKAISTSVEDQDQHTYTNQQRNNTFVSRFFFKIPTTVRSTNTSIHQHLESIPKKGDSQHHQNDGEICNKDNSCELVQGSIHSNDVEEMAHTNKNEGYSSEQKEVLTIEHKMATSIQDVGYQVWSGALLLCDYILHHPSQLQDCVVLDMGAGPALTSIVAAMFARTVICTDYCPAIIHLAKSNWERNKDLIPTTSSCPEVLFKVLDWNNNPFESSGSDTKYASDASTSTYQVPQSDDHADRALLEGVKVILAAEVVYDEDITDAFFRTIFHMLSTPPAKCVFMSLEKRIVFNTATASVCSPAYTHFRENLEDLTSVDPECSFGGVSFTADRITTDFRCCFEYDRMKELELWKISSYFPS